MDVLLIIDLQEGFINPHIRKPLISKIVDLSKNYDTVIATKYIYNENSFLNIN